MASEDSYPIVGMSPGNSYFKTPQIRYLLKEVIERFGRTAILIADIPAIATYKALGYSKSKARNKAILKGNNLKNKVRKIQGELGLASDAIFIIDWAKDIENDVDYQKVFERISGLYKDNLEFRDMAHATTKSVLDHAKNGPVDIDGATEVGVHYLLSELAFMEFSPAFLRTKNVTYVYHKSWPIYEDYLAGKFDGQPKPYLNFLVIKNPKETI